MLTPKKTRNQMKIPGLKASDLDRKRLIPSQETSAEGSEQLYLFLEGRESSAGFRHLLLWHGAGTSDSEVAISENATSSS